MTQVKMTRDLERALLESLANAGDWEVSEWRARNYRLGVTIYGLSSPADLDISLPDGTEISDAVPFGLFVPWRWRLWLAAIRARPKPKPVPSASSDVVAAIRRRSGSLVVPA